jgi:TRAP transporter TAXI family solute receptor
MKKTKRAIASTSSGTSLRKALTLLRAFIDRQPSWGVRELALAMKQPSSTVHRLLQVLRDEGLLDWDAEAQEYRTGMELHRWSAVLRQRLKVAEVARPIMERLVAELGESCWLGIYDVQRNQHVYIAEHRTEQALTFHAPIGSFEPLSACAGGWAMAAFLGPAEQAKAVRDVPATVLSDVRMRGYAIRDADQPGSPVFVAAPVFDSQNVPVASLTIVGPAFRLSGGLVSNVGERVAEQAKRLSQVLGAQLLGVAAGAGAWRHAAGALGIVLQRRVPGVGATAWSAGGEKLLRDVQDGRGGYCLAVAGSLVQAYSGEAPFEKPYDRLRAMLSLFPIYLHIVARRDAPIRSFKDLLRLRVSAGERDFTTARVVSRLLQIARGSRTSKANDPHLVYLDYAEANREFLKGDLDAVISLTSLQDPAYHELEERIPIRLVGLERELLDTFVRSSRSYGVGVIPAGTYAGWRRDVATLSVPTVLATSSDRPATEVYNVTRAIFESAEDLRALSPSFGSLDARFAFRPLEVPLHAGAERYWKEQNALLDDSAPSAGGAERALTRR